MNVVRYLPLRLVSEANAHEHWRQKSKRAHEQRGLTFMTLTADLWAFAERLARDPRFRVRVHLTRVGKRKLDDDNLARAFKAVRDGIADALGIDDGDECLQWRYHQSIASRYEVRIEVMGGYPVPAGAAQRRPKSNAQSQGPSSPEGAS